MELELNNQELLKEEEQQEQAPDLEEKKEPEVVIDVKNLSVGFTVRGKKINVITSIASKSGYSKKR